MAKYKYEKWSIKWDESKWNATASRVNYVPAYRINPDGSTTEMSNYADYNVGDICLTALNFKNEYDQGLSTYIVQVKAIYSDHMYLSARQYTKTQILRFRLKGDYIETIKADEDEYPLDGILGDYWYVRGEKAFPSLKLNGLNVASAEIKDSVGQVRNVGNVYFKDSAGVVRNLK